MSEARSRGMEIHSTCSMCDQDMTLTCCIITPAGEISCLLVSRRCRSRERCLGITKRFYTLIWCRLSDTIKLQPPHTKQWFCRFCLPMTDIFSVALLSYTTYRAVIGLAASGCCCGLWARLSWREVVFRTGLCFVSSSTPLFVWPRAPTSSHTSLVHSQAGGNCGTSHVLQYFVLNLVVPWRAFLAWNTKPLFSCQNQE